MLAAVHRQRERCSTKSDQGRTRSLTLVQNGRLGDWEIERFTNLLISQSPSNQSMNMLHGRCCIVCIYYNRDAALGGTLGNGDDVDLVIA